MVRVSEDLVRKRAEHNECDLSTLEEVSLHQQDIERIENIDKWCRELKILYLQSNLIPKIENVARLKKLQYLNLALNNVEKVENLEACESLQKLDLTVNFVGELTSIENLKDLPHFMELYLTGNPCCEYIGYRQYVIATLINLKYLDGTEVEKSERILAIQDYEQTRRAILEQQESYKKKRAQQIADDKIRKEKKSNRAEKGPGYDGRWYTDITQDSSKKDAETNADDDKDFWEEKVPFTPESRIEVHEHMEKQRRKDEAKDETPLKVERRLKDDDGRPFNINEAKVEFSFFDDEENNRFVLDLSYYKHMDSSLLDIDVQTDYVRVIAKGKIFQLRLEKDINADQSSAKRSQVSGHLLITMPKANGVIKVKPKSAGVLKKQITKDTNNTQQSGNAVLEVDPTARKTVNYASIVQDKGSNVKSPLTAADFNRRVKCDDIKHTDIIDDYDVPPLI